MGAGINWKTFGLGALFAVICGYFYINNFLGLGPIWFIITVFSLAIIAIMIFKYAKIL